MRHEDAAKSTSSTDVGWLPSQHHLIAPLQVSFTKEVGWADY